MDGGAGAAKLSRKAKLLREIQTVCINLLLNNFLFCPIRYLPVLDLFNFNFLIFFKF